MPLRRHVQSVAVIAASGAVSENEQKRQEPFTADGALCAVIGMGTQQACGEIKMSYCWNCRRIFYSQDRYERLCEHCKQQETLPQYDEKQNKPQTRGGGIK
jgi:hypothetical protein